MNVVVKVLGVCALGVATVATAQVRIGPKGPEPPKPKTGVRISPKGLEPPKPKTGVRIGPKGPERPKPRTGVRIRPKGPERPKPETGGKESNQPSGSVRQLVVTPSAVDASGSVFSFDPASLRTYPGNAVPVYLEAALEFQRSVGADRQMLSTMARLQDGLLLGRRTVEEVAVLQETRGVSGLLRDATSRSRTIWPDDPPSVWALSWDAAMARRRALGHLFRCLGVVGLEIRSALTRGDYRTAERWMQRGWRLAGDVGQHPRLEHTGMATSMSHYLLNQARLWIATPGSPNLYWTLASLSVSPADPVKAFEYELRLPERALLGGHEDAMSVSNEEWRRTYRDLERYGTTGMGHRTAAYLTLFEFYASAKRDLLDWGYSSEHIDSLSPQAIVLLHQSLVARHNRRALTKWLGFPPRERAHRLQETLATLEQEGWVGWRGRYGGREWLANFRLAPGAFSSSVLVVQFLRIEDSIQVLDAKRKALMVVEALRHYSKTHGGTLPKSLEAITELPVPENPITRAPFHYELLSPGEVIIGIDVRDTFSASLGDWQALHIRWTRP